MTKKREEEIGREGGKGEEGGRRKGTERPMREIEERRESKGKRPKREGGWGGGGPETERERDPAVEFMSRVHKGRNFTAGCLMEKTSADQ